MGDAAVMFGAGVIFGVLATVALAFFLAREMNQSRRKTAIFREGVIAPPPPSPSQHNFCEDLREEGRRDALNRLCHLPLCDDCKRSIG